MSEAMINLLISALGDTLIMVFASALFGCLLGLPLGVALHVTKAGQILANPLLNKVLGVIVNVGRSVPFIILLVAIIPLTRFIVGTSIGTMLTVNAAGGEYDFIDTTTIHANGRTQIPGLPSAASYSFDNIWDVTDAGLVAMKNATDLQSKRCFKFTFG